PARAIPTARTTQRALFTDLQAYPDIRGRESGVQGNPDLGPLTGEQYLQSVQGLLRRPRNGQIDRRGGGGRLGVDLGRECPTGRGLADQAGGRVHHGGRTHGEADVAVQRGRGGRQGGGRDRLAEPHDPRSGEAAAVRAPRRNLGELRRVGPPLRR